MAWSLKGRILAVVLSGSLLSGAIALSDWPGARWAVPSLMLVQVLGVWLLMRTKDPDEMVSQSVLESVSSFDTTLRIGDETLPYLRQGLNSESAQKICEIIHKITEVDAVAITDEHQILGFHGIGCRRHQQGGPILTGATRYVLDTGEHKVVTDPNILSCDEEGCPHPLKAAVITPLRYRGKVVGTFKLYRASSQPLPSYVARLAVGISALLGLQMELGEADRQRELATKARLEALQAQIRPHFLFNVLNTIVMFSRTDPERTRELLTTLARFFRRALSHRDSFISLQDEAEYVNTYLELEQARFGEKLQVRISLDPRTLDVRIPVLTLQPLVENAVVHGLAPQEDGGRLTIRARKVGRHLQISICDNGVGMEAERQARALETGFGANHGLGMSNVNDRLISLYGERYRLRIKSSPGRGTCVRVRVPLEQQ